MKVMRSQRFGLKVGIQGIWRARTDVISPFLEAIRRFISVLSPLSVWMAGIMKRYPWCLQMENMVGAYTKKGYS